MKTLIAFFFFILPSLSYSQHTGENEDLCRNMIRVPADYISSDTCIVYTFADSMYDDTEKFYKDHVVEIMKSRGLYKQGFVFARHKLSISLGECIFYKVLFIKTEDWGNGKTIKKKKGTYSLLRRYVLCNLRTNRRNPIRDGEHFLASVRQTYKLLENMRTKTPPRKEAKKPKGYFAKPRSSQKSCVICGRPVGNTCGEFCPNHV